LLALSWNGMSANDHLPTQEDYADPVTIEEEIELEEDGTAGSDDGEGGGGGGNPPGKSGETNGGKINGCRRR